MVDLKALKTTQAPFFGKKMVADGTSLGYPLITASKLGGMSRQMMNMNTNGVPERTVFDAIGRHATNAPRLLTYSHDGFGLGHLRRNTVIARQFVSQVPGATALMLVGCPVGAAFRLAPGIDTIKIPSVIKAGTGQWESRLLRTSPQELRALRQALILTTANLFKPDLLLVDYTPTGVWDELIPTLQMLRARRDRPMIILGLRDILDAPAVTRALWQRHNAYEAIQRYYDRVFIYGARELFETAGHYGINGPSSHKVRYCGYVCSGTPTQTPAQVRQRFRITRERCVVIAAGGGYDAYPIMRMCLDAVRWLGPRCPFETIMITGPLMDEAQQGILRTLAADLPVHVLTFTDDLVNVLSAADVVITMASYNTLVEAISLGKRVLVLPREGPSAEQRMRADLFSQQGIIEVVSPDQQSPSALAQRILEQLDHRQPGTTPRPMLPTDGAVTVVQRMTKRLQPTPIPV